MIVQGMTTSFKGELPLGVHDLVTDTLKMALYTANANLNANTTVYSASNEISGTGYSAGGEVILGVTVETSNNTAYISFDNVVWNPASFTARCALIYNASKANKSVAVLDFGADKTTTSSFTVQLPPNTAADAVLRIS
jgi:O-acetylhomoserine/O-acetylserine sulfhydrylase-like pyridoxal-dependent enzyme